MTARVLIVGGGTGGHISPGIALYEEFKSRGIEVKFLAGKNDNRFSSINDIEEGDLYFYGAPAFTKNILRLPFFLISFAAAVMRARKIIQNDTINAVIGMGGFVSAPALAASVMTKIPLYLCEQNTVPGKVTSLFAQKAEKIFTTFKETNDYVDKNVRFKCEQLGNPIRKKVFTAIDKEGARRAYNLKHCRKVILAIGGSQGALTINELVHGLKSHHGEKLNGVGIIWSTGDYSYRRFKDAIQNECDYGSVYLSSFIDDVGTAYRASDLAISRAGSGVMMELAAMGIPTILIPYPYAAMNHQEKNADVFDKAGAAVKVPNSDAVPDKMASVLSDLLNNPTQLSKMSKKALEMAKPNAASDIVEAISRDIARR